MMEQIPSFSKLLEQDPASIYQWIQQIQAGKKPAPGKFNWLGLAEIATNQASLDYHLVGQQALIWAYVALAAYSYLIDTNTSGNRDSLELSLMHLRALLIRKYGNVPHNPLLDEGQIVRWFLARLPFSFVEVQLKVNKLKTLPVDDLLELRRIKNRLSVILPLVHDQKLQPNAELQRWLMLREQLP